MGGYEEAADGRQALATALAWQAAVSRRDEAAALALSAPAIELIGPRGTARGHAALRDWLGRAGLELTERRRFAGGGRVVLEQHGVWRSPETGELVGEAAVASYLLVERGLVAAVARFEELAEALAAADLSAADEVSSDSQAA